MKTFPSIVLFTFALSGAFAQTPPLTVAVSDFAGDSETLPQGRQVAALITADLSNDPGFALVERAEMNKALGEQALGRSGMVSANAAAKLGKVTGAKVLVSGQVIKLGPKLVTVASIIGTENARLFAVKVEGTPDNLPEFSAELSRQIAQAITKHRMDLVSSPQEPKADRLERVIKNFNGKNRPSVALAITQFGHTWKATTVETELGAILMKAGFKVVDEKSDQKPDLLIDGRAEVGMTSQRGGLHSASYTLDVSVRERRTGKFIAFDRQESTASDSGEKAAIMAATIKATDDLAERLLPTLAK